jgi:hypothetical protein
MTDRNEHLDVLFESARRHAPVPSEALMARVTADAVASQAAPDLSTQGTRAKPGPWRQVWQGLGGWPAMGGLVTATCAGIWLGVYPPQSVALVAEGLFTGETVSPLIDMTFEGAFDLAQEAL